MPFPFFLYLVSLTHAHARTHTDTHMHTHPLTNLLLLSPISLPVSFSLTCFMSSLSLLSLQPLSSLSTPPSRQLSPQNSPDFILHSVVTPPVLWSLLCHPSLHPSFPPACLYTGFLLVFVSHGGGNKPNQSGGGITGGGETEGREA